MRALFTRKNYKLEITGGKIRVSAEEVASFNRAWPASKLDPRRAYWFDFYDGELSDTDVPEHSDGPEAAAMADDCKAYLFDDVTPVWAKD